MTTQTERKPAAFRYKAPNAFTVDPMWSSWMDMEDNGWHHRHAIDQGYPIQYAYEETPVITKQKLYDLAEAAFVAKDSWHVSTDALLKFCFQRGPDGNGARNGSDNSPGDTVYTSPSGSEMTRHMAERLWEYSGNYRCGWADGYEAALVSLQGTPIR